MSVPITTLDSELSRLWAENDILRKQNKKLLMVLKGLVCAEHTDPWSPLWVQAARAVLKEIEAPSG